MRNACHTSGHAPWTTRPTTIPTIAASTAASTMSRATAKRRPDDRADDEEPGEDEEEVGGDLPHAVEKRREAGEEATERAHERRRRHSGRADRDERHRCDHEQDRVGRPARPRLADGDREQSGRPADARIAALLRRQRRASCTPRLTKIAGRRSRAIHFRPPANDLRQANRAGEPTLTTTQRGDAVVGRTPRLFAVAIGEPRARRATDAILFVVTTVTLVAISPPLSRLRRSCARSVASLPASRHSSTACGRSPPTSS